MELVVFLFGNTPLQPAEFWCGRGAVFFHPASDGAAERFRTTKTGPTRQKELSA